MKNSFPHKKFVLGNKRRVMTPREEFLAMNLFLAQMLLRENYEVASTIRDRMETLQLKNSKME